MKPRPIGERGSLSQRGLAAPGGPASSGLSASPLRHRPALSRTDESGEFRAVTPRFGADSGARDTLPVAFARLVKAVDVLSASVLSLQAELAELQGRRAELGWNPSESELLEGDISMLAALIAGIEFEHLSCWLEVRVDEPELVLAAFQFEEGWATRAVVGGCEQRVEDALASVLACRSGSFRLTRD